MANVQVENGYTEIANELIEALAQTSLRSTEWQVVLYLIRTTYGWHKKNAKLSVHEVALGTNLRDEMAARAIRQLRARNIITAVGDDHHPKTYSIQKDYEKWQGDYSQVTTGKSLPRGSHYRKVTTSESGKSLPDSSQSDYQTVVSLPYSKENKEKKERDTDAPHPADAPTTRPEIDGATWAAQNLADPMNPWYMAACEFLRYNPEAMKYGGREGNAKSLKADYDGIRTPEEITERVRLLTEKKVKGRTARQLFDALPSQGLGYPTADQVMQREKDYMARMTAQWAAEDAAKAKAQEATP